MRCAFVWIFYRESTAFVGLATILRCQGQTLKLSPLSISVELLPAFELVDRVRSSINLAQSEQEAFKIRLHIPYTLYTPLCVDLRLTQSLDSDSPKISYTLLTKTRRSFLLRLLKNINIYTNTTLVRDGFEIQFRVQCFSFVGRFGKV